MSFRKLNAEVKALVRRLEEMKELTQALHTGFVMVSESIEDLNQRLEKLETRKKPGPKPKSLSHRSESPEVSATTGNGTTKPETTAVQ